jgi:hypothetical protein
MKDDKALYESTLMQFRQRILGKPYLDPGELSVRLPGAGANCYDAAELAELVFQMRQVTWAVYVSLAKGLGVRRPEKLYDFVKANSGQAGKPLLSLEAIAAEE